MKKILNLSVIFLLFLSIMSCSSDDDKTVATATDAPVLISPQDGTAIVLDKELKENPAIGNSLAFVLCMVPCYVYILYYSIAGYKAGRG